MDGPLTATEVQQFEDLGYALIETPFTDECEPRLVHVPALASAAL